jgi:hypothetical protein
MDTGEGADVWVFQDSGKIERAVYRHTEGQFSGTFFGWEDRPLAGVTQWMPRHDNR